MLFQAFRQHELHEPLVEPGSADLTADVDFSYLKELAGDKGNCCQSAEEFPTPGNCEI